MAMGVLAMARAAAVEVGSGRSFVPPMVVPAAASCTTLLHAVPAALPATLQAKPAASCLHCLMGFMLFDTHMVCHKLFAMMLPIKMIGH